MASRFILALLLVGFACLCSGADIRKMLEELLSEDAPKNDKPLPAGLPRLPAGFPRPPGGFRRPPMPPANKCVMDGKTYEFGDRWIDEKCTARCRCRRFGVGCVSLCPPNWAKCGPGEVESTEQVPADREGRCFCRVAVCVKKGEIESMAVKK